MKVQKLTLENLKLLKEQSNNALVKYVCNYVIIRWDEYDDKKDIFLDVIKNGCKSGIVGDLYYYEQTTSFYNAYKHEINKLIYECGYNNLAVLFGDEWNKHDPLALDEYNQNLLAWFGFEETARNIARKFGIED